MTSTLTETTRTAALGRIAILVLVEAATVLLARMAGFEPRQVLACAIFVLIIMATLLFWNYRLAVTLVGIVALLGSRTLTLQSFVASTELDIILFLVGMMITVGVLKDLGLFTWIIQLVLASKRMSGKVFVLITVFLSAIMACVVGEVSGMVFMCVLIFQVCDTLKLRALPFIMISVMSTNIGSTGTMLGNPVGILLGYKAGFTFVDFITWAFPVMLMVLLVNLGLLCWWFRKDISLLTERLEARRTQGLGLSPLIRVPYRSALAILVGMMSLIALHHVLEKALGVEKNTVLIATPLLVSGALMLWRPGRARHHIEADVEWWTLLFFMMLFAIAGSLAHTGVTARIADGFINVFGSNVKLLTPLVLGLSAVGSAFLDNVVFVAAFIPIVRDLGATSLWWALLFGACFGGNITMIGSTANIVALGMLEKRYRTQTRFAEWLKIGLVVGTVSCIVAWGALTILSPYMPVWAPAAQAVVAEEHD